MSRRDLTLTLLAAAAAGSGCATRGPSDDPLRFDPERFGRMDLKVGGSSLPVRAYEALPVLSRPLEPAYQALNLYVPEAYFSGGRVGAFDAASAPFFLPIGVGGYLPARPGTLAVRMPSPGQSGAPSASALALSRGWIVAAPGARGRTLQGAGGVWIGKAPAAIVDLKAAVRWLRHNAALLPGRVERIVCNGTSAGGALAALLGASGNHPDYQSELQALGAADTRDDVFAVSAFCPITHLAHADAAYEWQFEGLREFRSVAVSMLDFRVQRREVQGQLDEAQQAWSTELRADFVAHVKRLGLRGPDGLALDLRPDGSGGLREHIVSLLMQSAQRALQAGQDLPDAPWITVQQGRVQALDFAGYVRAIGRMKGLPAFDGLALETAENQLFGNADTDRRHFTSFSARHSQVAGAERADEATVRAMDAVQQLGDARSSVAAHWRIRHGSLDRDISLAVPVLLAAAARQRGAAVDLALPWGRPHSGDYELDALFGELEATLLEGRA